MTRLASRCAALGLLLTTPACTTMEWEAMAVGLAQGFASADYGQNSCAPGYMWQSSYDSLGNPVSWCEPASYYTLPADLPPGWEAGIDRGGHRHDHDRAGTVPRARAADKLDLVSQAPRHWRTRPVSTWTKLETG